MKKVLLSLAVVAALGMTSCGGSEACDCAEKGLAMTKEMKALDGDMTKMEEVMKKYETDLKACEEVFKKMEEGLSDEEKEAKKKELEESCPAFKEISEQGAF